MPTVQLKEDLCMGCGLCRVYCALAHSMSRDLIRAFRKERPRPLPRIRVEQSSGLFLPVQCRHCAESPCVYACLTGALYRDPDSGRVAVDPRKCTGCWTCIMVCPYAAIRRDLERNIIAKCDLCPDLDVPACVANCPNEALVYVRDGTNG